MISNVFLDFDNKVLSYGISYTIDFDFKINGYTSINKLCSNLKLIFFKTFFSFDQKIKYYLHNYNFFYKNL